MYLAYAFSIYLSKLLKIQVFCMVQAEMTGKTACGMCVWLCVCVCVCVCVCAEMTGKTAYGMTSV